MRPFFLTFTVACSQATEPAQINTPEVDTPAEPDTDVVITPRVWSLHVVPAEPRWDEDLHCVPDGAGPDELLDIGWTVNGVAWSGTGDTVPHLSQAGGQRWSCHAGLADGSTAASPYARVEPPMPMADMPPGKYLYSRYYGVPGTNPNATIALTRWHLFAKLEVTVGDMVRWAGYRPDGFTPDVDDIAVFLRTVDEAMALSNALSVADGLTPCFACTGAGPEVACTRPTNAYECEGYRPPTFAEWEYAYYGAGTHHDMLPAGGNWTRYSETDFGRTYDAPAWGPNAPPNSMISDQCNNLLYYRYPLPPPPGGQLLPTRQGIYDLCGSVSELLVDVPGSSAETPVDPYELRDERSFHQLSVGGAYDMDTDSLYPFAARPNAAGIRIVRTNTPNPVETP